MTYVSRKMSTYSHVEASVKISATMFVCHVLFSISTLPTRQGFGCVPHLYMIGGVCLFVTFYLHFLSARGMN